MIDSSQKSINFIGIGAQKAGTTWLYARLNELSEFSLLPHKELHYFDRSVVYPSPNTFSESKLSNRIKDINWLRNSFFKTFKQIV